MGVDVGAAMAWFGGMMADAAPYIAATVISSAATQAMTPDSGGGPDLASLMQNFDAGAKPAPQPTAPNTPESTPATRAQQAVKAVKPTKGRTSTILTNPATLLGPANELLG
jgi:hypothetical protein